MKNFGVNKYTNKIRDACQVNETLFQNEKCSDFPYKESFLTWWDSNCKGKDSCKLDISTYKNI